MIQKLIGFLAICTFVAGCASTQPINSADRVSLGSVKINPSVSKPPHMYYLGPGGGVGMMFGAIGGALSADSIKSSREQFQQFAEEHDAFIERIVLDETTNLFRQSGKVSLTESAGQNVTTLNIAITQYGFSIPNGFSSNLLPILSIKYSLVDSSGKTIWSANDSAYVMGNPVEGRTLEEFKENPKLMGESWRLVTRVLATRMIANL